MTITLTLTLHPKQQTVACVGTVYIWPYTVAMHSAVHVRKAYMSMKLRWQKGSRMRERCFFFLRREHIAVAVQASVQN